MRGARKPCPPHPVNSLLAMLGIESWKPVLTALLLPPVPFLFLILVGARLLLPRRGLGWLLIFFSVVMLWLSACSGAAYGLMRFGLQPPSALSFERINALRAEAATKKATAIVVLGGGTEPFAPEYGVGSLSDVSLARLRYGVWLAKQTGLPLAFSGGVGWGQADSTPEARIAAKIAADELGQSIKWIEDDSRDTRENAMRTVALLKYPGITHIVLVTHATHMPRALRAFSEAAGPGISIEAAPIGLARNVGTPAVEWIPSSAGFVLTRQVVREWLGRLAGA